MKTTLKQLIENIDFNNKELETSPNWEELANHLDIFDLYWSDDERLKCYFIKVHYCTDTRVGWRVYFLDNEFVIFSTQTSRKSNEIFEFVSIEASNKVKLYLESLVNPDVPEISLISQEKLNCELNDTYTIEYSSQILHKTAYYKNNKVKIVKKYNDYVHFHDVVIEVDGKQLEIDCRELRFKYNTIE